MPGGSPIPDVQRAVRPAAVSIRTVSAAVARRSATSTCTSPVEAMVKGVSLASTP